MKKIIILLFCLLPVSIYAVSHKVNEWTFEAQNGADTAGTATLTKAGSGTAAFGASLSGVGSYSLGPFYPGTEWWYYSSPNVVNSTACSIQYFFQWHDVSQTNRYAVDQPAGNLILWCNSGTCQAGTTGRTKYTAAETISQDCIYLMQEWLNGTALYWHAQPWGTATAGPTIMATVLASTSSIGSTYMSDGNFSGGTVPGACNIDDMTLWDITPASYPQQDATTPTVTPTVTPSITPSITPSVTQTVTPTVTSSITQTRTPTFTRTPTHTPTLTVTPTITPTCGLCIIYTDFSLVSSSTSIGARAFFPSYVFDNKMWVATGNHNGPLFDDVWYSTDGSSWTESTAAATGTGRYGATGCVFNGAMWLIGGMDGLGNYLNDVWNSYDGITWNCITAAAEFTGRYEPRVVVYDNGTGSKMWLMGGGNKDGYLNDVWYSADGSSWTESESSASWDPREAFVLLNYAGKMWVISGAGPNAPGGFAFKDAWYSTDGLTWIPATMNAAFDVRGWAFGMVANQWMWIGGGDYANMSTMRLDLWKSQDGATWTRVTADTGYHARESAGYLLYGNYQWVIAGNSKDASFVEDIWKGEQQLCLSATPTMTPTVSPTVTPTDTPTATPTFTSTITPTVTITSTFTVTASITRTATITPTITPAACLLPGDIHQTITDEYFVFTAGLIYNPPTTRRPNITTSLRCLSLNTAIAVYFTNTCLVISRVPKKYDFAEKIALAKATIVGISSWHYATPTVTPTPH